MGFCGASYRFLSTRIALLAASFAAKHERRLVRNAIALSRQEQNELRRFMADISLEGLPESLMSDQAKHNRSVVLSRPTRDHVRL
jgi:hypothetical protein